jgi:hypothetical protein
LELYSKLLDYYEEKLLSGGLFLWDLGRLEQYMYGKPHTDTDAEDSIYLVDTGISVSRDKKYLSTALSDILEALATQETERAEGVRKRAKILLTQINQRS